MNRLKIILLLMLLPVAHESILAQETQKSLTNADVLKLTKSGIGDQTVILMIEKANPNFDTSPDAIVELKKQGVPDAILTAILNASNVGIASTRASQDCASSLDFALASFGPRDKLAAIHSIRWDGKDTMSSTSARNSFSVERVTIFPSNIYVSLQPPSGSGTKLVMTAEFNYMSNGRMTTGIPAATLEEFQSGIKLEPAYIAQHRDQYQCTWLGNEQIGNIKTDKLKVTGDGVASVWNLDPMTGRILRTASNQSVTDFSDWKQANEISYASTRHTLSGAVTSDINIIEYQINPITDASLFQAPSGQVAEAVTLKVLQSESVPYVVETNGGISTACNISGSTNTSINSTTFGNISGGTVTATTNGTGTSNSNLQMNCKSSDTTIRWTHVLNAMFVHASDGNAYIIACDRAWLWSKCVPLKAGDTFLARRTDKGFLVQSLNGKSREQEATYSVLQSKSSHE